MEMEVVSVRVREDQRFFLDALPNQSEWLRDAIDEKRERMRRGEARQYLERLEGRIKKAQCGIDLLKKEMDS